MMTTYIRVTAVCLFLLVMPVLGGKEKVVKKRPVAVTDPWSLRTLDDWIDLGLTVLQKSCEAAALPSSGSITTLARRLYHFYNTLSTAEQGMRGFFFIIVHA